MLELDPLTIIWQIVNFLLLSTALYFVLFRPVMRSMKEREAEKERIARETAQDRQEAERLRAALPPSSPGPTNRPRWSARLSCKRPKPKPSAS
jgi:flagellar biosynthesis/type III secretory pathway M-ring protein FliF/YscJ